MSNTDEDGIAPIGGWTEANPRWKNRSAEATVKIAEDIAGMMCRLADDGDLAEFLGEDNLGNHHEDVLALAEKKAAGKPYLMDRVRVARGKIEMALTFKHVPPSLPLRSGKLN